MLQFVTVMLIGLLCIVMLKGIHAHEDVVNGFHDGGLVSGNAGVMIYSPAPNDFAVSASSSIEANEPPHPLEIIRGNYRIRVQVANFFDINEPVETVRFNSPSTFWAAVYDETSQLNSPTGLSGRAESKGDAAVYLWIIVRGKWRLVPLWHQHSTEWEDEDLVPIP